MEENREKLFLGLDCSTQTLKAIVIDENLRELSEFETVINYDVDLPHFNTRGGIHVGKDSVTVTTPTLVWVSALDLLLERLRTKKLPFEKIVAISGSGQQHGSVFWKKGARERLKDLDPTKKLSDQFINMFSIAASPIWMDSSTSKQCKELENTIGGLQKITELTGSIPYERFTINQIRKISQTQVEAYNNTERISLVSSFVCSLLISDYANIDYGDASGMNVMNLRTKTWVKEIIDFAAPELESKLGEPVCGHQVAGNISTYLTDRYGFHKDCVVISFSGDNPCSIAGLRMKEGDIAVSLGTSDTLFGPLSSPNPTLEGHIFCDPVRPHGYMALLCYKNGSLTREYIRDFYAYKDWTQFDEILQRTKPGNGGNIGFYFKEMEITPRAHSGITRFDENDQSVSEFPSNEMDVRGVIEGQFLSMLVHSTNIGMKISQIFATGGASKNKHIVQVLSDVFGVPVFTHTQPNSACAGAAFRALHGYKVKLMMNNSTKSTNSTNSNTNNGDDNATNNKDDLILKFEDVVCNAIPLTKEADPNREAHQVYSEMVKRYKELEKRVILKSN